MSLRGRGYNRSTHPPGNENTWVTLVVKFPPENDTAVSVVVAAMLASATELMEGSAISWRADDEFASRVIFDMISTRRALSGPGNESPRVEHLQPIIHNNFEREKFGKRTTAF